MLFSGIHVGSVSFSRQASFIPPVPDIANCSMKYFILSKVYSNEGGIKQLYHGLSICIGDNPLAKACGLSPFTGGQTMV